ncbi:hypothetical protein I5907_02000 [Panacibacter sp. DH6]|uniref:YD repeat-containing protein n=1 Tax=Panacibacter microcysteis TaxID=2793269 RepID=A0A931GVD7_9BACT|nr:hypothetical protein [Panacibacter microcysteis]MBG9374983.1 hypothetical protein [Panacibacter microcysteis]
MNMYRLAACFSGIILWFCSAGQPVNTNFLPKIGASSPEAMAMEKFVSYPVSLFTGATSVSVPIYTINVNGMKVPISLDYHASGIKVSEEASWVGLGWSLNAGGAINRNMRSLPDEISGYLDGEPLRTGGFLPNDPNDVLYLRLLSEHTIDGEPDIYSYNFPGHSGKFYHANQSSAPENVKIIPYSAIKIITSFFNGMQFTILDEAGIEYRFVDAPEITSPADGPYSYYSSWMLTEMISADKADTIKFSYSFEEFDAVGELMDYVSVTDRVLQDTRLNSECHNSYQERVTPGTSQRTSSIITAKLVGISFPGGKVEFVKNGNMRADIPNSKSLYQIKIFEKNLITNTDILLKYINLNQSYFLNNSVINPFNKYRLRLDAVVEYNAGNTSEKTYSFEYNTAQLLPDYAESRSKDYWGYFNNKANSSLVPRQFIALLSAELGNEQPSVWIGGAENGRVPDPIFNQACILKKVNFPTGGSASFEYETNKYYNYETGTVDYGGGVRIKQINHFDEYGKLALKKTYKYGKNENGYGRIIIPLPTRSFVSEEMHYPTTSCLSAGYCRVRNFSSSPSYSVDPFDGASVGYEEVAEYEGDDNNNNGKTVYQYSFYEDAFTSTYAYSKPNVVSYHYKRGELLHKYVYQSLSPGNYKLLQHTHNGYGAFPDNSAGAVDIVAFRKAYFDNGSNWNGFIEYDYNSYSVMQGDNRLISTIDTLWSQKGDLYTINKSEYTYGNINHQQITQIKQYVSGGDIITVNQKYPHDFVSTTVYNEMVNQAHIINPVIEKTELKNSFQRSLLKTNYKKWANYQYLPETIQQKIGTNLLETRATFYAYDNHSNVLSMAKQNDTRTSFLWAYKKSLLVAEAKNALHNELFFDSFEEDAEWDNNLITYDNTKSHTGNYAGKITKPTAGEQVAYSNKWLTIAITTPTRFRYSGWIYSEGPTADIFLFMKRTGETGLYSYVDHVTTTTTGKWVFVEKDFTVPADVTTISLRLDNNGGGNIWFDDLRLHRANAFVSTYTYKPLVGMTAQIDINNNTQFYEYDTYNRLKLIKDLNGNVIKTIDYKLKSSTPY